MVRSSSTVPRLRRKLSLGMVFLVGATALVSGYLSQTMLRRDAIARAERSLEEEARLVAELARTVPPNGDRTVLLDALVRRAAELTHARVTIMDRDGRVEADSDVSVGALPSVENHAHRSEIRDALAGKLGVAQRTSDTVGRNLLYVAVPREEGTGGAVRLSIDLEDVESMVASLRQALAWAGMTALGVAVLLAIALSSAFVRPLERMQTTLRRILGHDLDTHDVGRAGDELDTMLRAIDELGVELATRLEQLDEDREQLRAVLGAMIEGVIVVDAKGRIALANPRAREMLALPAEAEGRLPVEVIRKPAIQDVLDEIAHAGSTPVQREISFGIGDTTVLRVQGTTFPLPRGGRGSVAVFHDHSEIRRLETVRRDFVANASHELKTPLAAVRGFAETLLASDADIDARRRYLEIILANAERLGRIVDDLLELARAEDDSLSIELERVDAVQTAQTVLGRLEPRARERRVSAHLVAPAAAWVRTNPNALEQVLENLLDNAIKYTDAGGSVELRLLPAEDRVRVEVSDTGIGIPEADCARIFERFYRVDPARSRRLGGTGLGLSIVKHLVQAMGSEISVQSTPGRGSSFRFDLRSAPSGIDTIPS